MCKDDKFIVIASDGVWEFLQNEDVANIVYPYFEKRNAEGAAEALVRESYLRWKHEEDDIIDDITCVIIFLDVKLPQQAPTEHTKHQSQYNSETTAAKNNNDKEITKGEQDMSKKQ